MFEGKGIVWSMGEVEEGQNKDLPVLKSLLCGLSRIGQE